MPCHDGGTCFSVPSVSFSSLAPVLFRSPLRSRRELMWGLKLLSCEQSVPHCETWFSFFLFLTLFFFLWICYHSCKLAESLWEPDTGCRNPLFIKWVGRSLPCYKLKCDGRDCHATNSSVMVETVSFPFFFFFPFQCGQVWSGSPFSSLGLRWMYSMLNMPCLLVCIMRG